MQERGSSAATQQIAAAATKALATLRDDYVVADGNDSFSDLSEDDEVAPLRDISEPEPPSTANGSESGPKEPTTPQPAASLPNGVHAAADDADAPAVDGAASSPRGTATNAAAAAPPDDASSLISGAAQAAMKPNGIDGTCGSANALTEETAIVPSETLVDKSAGAGSAGVGNDAVCALCGMGSEAAVCGRMLPLGLGATVHLNCAIWSTEVFEKELGVLHQVPAAVRRSRRTACVVCGKLGASVGCFAKKCEQSFHFACALKAGVTYCQDKDLVTSCKLHKPKKGALPLPTFVERSVRVKPLNRLQILPAWQRSQLVLAASEQPQQQPQQPAETTADGVLPPNGGAAEAPPPGVILRIGALRVLRLGLPQPGRPAFHDSGLVTPLGFLSRRRYFDVLVPSGRCEYLCEVGEIATMPNFVITHERDPSVTFKGRTPAEAWSALVSRRHRTLHTRPPVLSPDRAKLEAAIFFGFGAPAVAQLIEQLPGAKGCEGFRPRYSMPEASQRAPPLPRSASGCARTDGYIKRSSAYKYEHSMYYRGFINRGSLPEREPPPELAELLHDERQLSLNLRRREAEGPKTAAQVAMRPGGVVAMLRVAHPVKVGRSPIHNWGLFTTRAVPKDGVVVEYMGTAMRNSAADKKEKVYEGGAFKGQGGDCYMFRLDGECVLDATMRGNIARFINHCMRSVG